MSAIAKTIWQIEAQLLKPLTLEQLAWGAGVSRTYLSRIFPIATGYSISAYLRGRRLSEAAKALAAGAPDILSVALDAGYGSHEAFTRAFRDQFDTTPEQVRRNASVDAIELVEPLSMHDHAAITLAPPRIEEIGPLRLAGLLERHEMTRAATLPAQWQKFQPYIGHVAGMIGRAAYGVVGEMTEDSQAFDYLTAIEVGPSAELPAEFTVVVVPRRRYARFRHDGHVSTIRSTIGAAFDDWLPASGHVAVHEGNSFIEYYGPAFDGRTGRGDIEIWAALKH